MKKILLLSLSLISVIVFGSGFFGGGGGGVIGGSVVGGLDGAVLFVHPNGILAQDTTNFFWDDTNNRLGLGTGTPSVQLHTTGGVRFGSLSTGIGHFDSNGVLSSSAVSLTADVSGILPLANGGSNKNFTASLGSVVYSDADSFEASAVGSSGQILQSAGAAAPAWTTATYPGTTTVNQLLYSSSANVVAGLSSANTSALVTNSSGVPSFTSGSTANRLLRTNGTAVSFSQADLTTDVTGILPIANGGTNASSFSATNGLTYYNGTRLVNSSNVTYDGTSFTASGNVVIGSVGFDTYLLTLSGVDTGVVRYDDTGLVYRAGLITNTDVSSSANISLSKIDGGTIHRLTYTSLGPGLSQLAAGSSGQLLQSAGSLADPAWTTATYPATATNTGRILRSNGTNWVETTATYPTTTSTSQILYSSSANVVAGISTAFTSALITNGTGVPSWTNGGTANRLLRTDGNAVSFAQANLTTDVTGTLPYGNGGTGATAFTNHGVVTAGAAALTTVAPSTAGNVLTSDGTDWTSAAASSSPTASDAVYNVGVAATVAASALTIALKQADGTDCSAGSPCKIGFRNATAGTGQYSQVSVTGSLSTVISSGSTAGFANGVTQYLYIYAINNAGTAELAWAGVQYDEGTVKTSTAEGGAGGADSVNVLYSTTGRASVPIRLLGRLKLSEATAGTWASNPTEISLNPFFPEAVYAAYYAGAQTMEAAGGGEVVAYVTKVEDSHNMMNTSTGVYTCPKSGIYMVSQSNLFASGAWVATNFVENQVRVDSSMVCSEIKRVEAAFTSGLGFGGPPCIVRCNSGQTIDGFVDHDRSAGNINLDGTANYDRISINWIGP